ncbi:MAG TPA: cyclase family protein [Nitrososphaerales archaeon]|nr:cyclase family protein [Nitrososphaerales archaeon]
MADNWYPSKWGAEDEVGALGAINPSKIIQAARLVKNGKTYNLAHILEEGIPSLSFHGHFLYTTFRRHSVDLKSPGKTNNAGGMNTRLEMADHTGTHIDGLNHISIGEKLYNGHVSEEIMGTFGTEKLGIEKTPPIFTRGVLIDVASFSKVTALEGGYAISAKEIRNCMEAAKMKITEGDVALIRTGWGRYWMSDNTKFLGPVPGIDLSAAEWLANQGAVVVGSDTWNVEVDPSKEVRGADDVHQYLITKNGIRMIENLFLEEVSRDRVSEFLFVCLPLRIRGGTGSPVTPLAVT